MQLLLPHQVFILSIKQKNEKKNNSVIKKQHLFQNKNIIPSNT